ncbi:MAG: radical SAM protein [Tissierellia bacterium]|nr:radical SAM protein [Tissierellia bacterium]
MFYPKKQVYIKNRVFYDLNDMKIFQIDNEIEDIFYNLYYGKSIKNKNENYALIKNHYFKEKNDNKDELNNFNSKITNIQIKISNKCNMNCEYCFANKGNYNKKDVIMDNEVLDKIAEFVLNRKQVKKISFFGGEPLLDYKGIIRFVKKVNRKDILYSIVTNATILNDEIINLLKEFNIKLIVSIDGDEKTHDKYRRFKNGEKFLKLIDNNVEKLNDENIKISMIEAVYTKNSEKNFTKHELANILHEKYKVPIIGISDVISEDNNLIVSNDLKENDTEFVIEKIKNEEFFYISNSYNIISRLLERNKSNFFLWCWTKFNIY